MIVKLAPALKNYIWGGTKLKTLYGKKSEENVAESWELSFNEAGASVISTGNFVGKMLKDVATPSDWGTNCERFPFFPVLNKLIDAEENLSVQVHPDDVYALKNEGQFGKTEMWYVLDAEEDAVIYLGLNRDMTAREFVQAVENKTVLSFLNAVPVKKGDAYFIESGTLHAIGAGVTLFEIQQNSTLTYRVYDYGRRDKNGNLRELHLEKATQTANLQKYDVPDPKRENLLGKCQYFTAYRYFSGTRSFCFFDTFCSITVIDGSAKIGELILNKGETAFVSAKERFCVEADGEYVLTLCE